MQKYLNYRVENGIAYLTVNRPEVRNAMNADCWIELAALTEMAENDPQIKVLILTGAGSKAFIAGADVSALKQLTGVENLFNNSQKALKKIENCAKPVIAAINGLAFGGGFETALVCDIRIASPNARFGLPETGLGIMPGAGGTQRLSRTIGIGRAKEMILAGKNIDAQEAMAAGLVMKVVDQEHLMEEAISIANTMMSKGPVSLHIAKKMVNASLDIDTNSGILLESLGFSVLLGTLDKIEGTNAYLEKRPPKFTGS